MNVVKISSLNVIFIPLSVIYFIVYRTVTHIIEYKTCLLYEAASNYSKNDTNIQFLKYLEFIIITICYL